MKFFNPEDGGNMFLPKVCIHYNLTQYQNPEARYPKNPHPRKKYTTRDITVFHLSSVLSDNGFSLHQHSKTSCMEICQPVRTVYCLIVVHCLKKIQSQLSQGTPRGNYKTILLIMFRKLRGVDYEYHTEN
jgi:hypothetical protein